MGRDIRSFIALYLAKSTFGSEKLPEELEAENEGLKILFAIRVDGRLTSRPVSVTGALHGSHRI